MVRRQIRAYWKAQRLPFIISSRLFNASRTYFQINVSNLVSFFHTFCIFWMAFIFLRRCVYLMFFYPPQNFIWKQSYNYTVLHPDSWSFVDQYLCVRMLKIFFVNRLRGWSNYICVTKAKRWQSSRMSADLISLSRLFLNPQ